MAKIQVTPELLASALFHNCSVEVTGASFNHETNTVDLEISGEAVPDAKTVKAICHLHLGEFERERIVTTFFEKVD